jgi:hypothetical protein
MSKKHFQKLAYELMMAKPVQGPEESDREHFSRQVQWQLCVAAVAHACAQSNGVFDRGRFFEACYADQYTPSMHGR